MFVVCFVLQSETKFPMSLCLYQRAVEYESMHI